MKDFDIWNSKKKNIEQTKRVVIKTGSVWICNFGLNIGYEIDGKNQEYTRPCLVLLGLEYGGGIVVPLTSTNKQSKFFIKLNNRSNINLSQIRYLDSKRFRRKIFIVDKNKMKEVIEALFKLLKI